MANPSAGPAYAVLTLAQPGVFPGPAFALTKIPVDQLCSTRSEDYLPCIGQSLFAPQRAPSTYAFCLQKNCATEWNAIKGSIYQWTQRKSAALADYDAGARLQQCGMRACADQFILHHATVCVPLFPAAGANVTGTLSAAPENTPSKLADAFATKSPTVGFCALSAPLGSGCTPVADLVLQSATGAIPLPNLSLTSFAQAPSDVINAVTANPAAGQIFFRLPLSIPSILSSAPNDGSLGAAGLAILSPDNGFLLARCNSSSGVVVPTKLATSDTCRSSLDCAFTPCTGGFCAPISVNQTDFLVKSVENTDMISQAGSTDQPAPFYRAVVFNPLYLFPIIIGAGTVIAVVAWILDVHTTPKVVRKMFSRERALEPADRRMLDRLPRAYEDAADEELPTYATHEFSVRPAVHPPNEDDLIYQPDPNDPEAVAAAAAAAAAESGGDAVEPGMEQEAALDAMYREPPPPPIDALSSPSPAAARAQRASTVMAMLRSQGMITNNSTVTMHSLDASMMMQAMRPSTASTDTPPPPSTPQRSAASRALERLRADPSIAGSASLPRSARR
ncbi:hypothetical protein BC828DRAFT_120946 [Blastocladiella britannica]|nr:hypothetical protein BC828DRAFT_120946 [Blastocladiella britannica]